MKHPIAALLVLLALPLAGQAGNCKLDIQPVTSGFFLNPTLDKLTVRSMRSVKPGVDCKLQQGDEIVQINAQAVPGRKACEVQVFRRPEAGPAAPVQCAAQRHAADAGPGGLNGARCPRPLQADAAGMSRIRSAATSSCGKNASNVARASSSSACNTSRQASSLSPLRESRVEMPRTAASTLARRA